MNANGSSSYAATDEEEELALALALSASLLDQEPLGSHHPSPSSNPIQRYPSAIPYSRQQPSAPSNPNIPRVPPSHTPHSHPLPSRPVAPPTLTPTPTPSKPPRSLFPRLPNLLPSSGTCAGCQRPIYTTYTAALGKTWHTGCLKCACCNEPISQNGNVEFVVHTDNQIYHVDCHTVNFHPSCSVCGQFIPQRADGKLEYSVSPFWRDKYCPAHQHDGTPSCCSCSRLQQQGKEFVQLQDGRHLCLSCLGSIVEDTTAAQPLYSQVQEFYRGLGMAHPEHVPLMMVDASALNEFTSREGGRADGPRFHVRGLTLTEMYRNIPSVVRNLGAGPLLNVGHQLTSVQRAHCNVTAILVIYGLPRLLTGAIIAHELMHAWLRMKGVVDLNLQVEEGLCQLMALLWLDQERERLEGQGGEVQGGDERLGAFFGYEIREDTSATYGDGFRMAFECYQNFGLMATVDHVMSTGRLPM